MMELYKKNTRKNDALGTRHTSANESNRTTCFLSNGCPSTFLFAEKVCLREGKELLSFIERLAGTTELKTMTEEVHTSLDDLREEVLSLEVEVTESRHRRSQLQPQVRF